MGADCGGDKRNIGISAFLSGAIGGTGETIAEYIGKGPAVGAFQRTLLARIQTGELLNTEGAQWEALLKKAERRKTKI